MLGRTPGNITAIRPMKDGVIADEITEASHYFINKVNRTRTFIAPRIVVAVPSGITQKLNVEQSRTLPSVQVPEMLF